MPQARKTGFRPLISENGANTIGATAKPQVKMVMPTRTATWLTCHSSDIWATPGLYDPAVKAAMAVARHESQRMMDLCLGDQSKGLPYFLRLGHTGGGGAPS